MMHAKHPLLIQEAHYPYCRHFVPDGGEIPSVVTMVTVVAVEVEVLPQEGRHGDARPLTIGSVYLTWS